MSASGKRIALIGPSVDGMGGVATVIRNILREYSVAGGYELFAVPTIAGKASPSVYLKAVRNVWRMAKSGEIDLAHVHMASKGSFLRKSLIIRMLHSHGVPVIIHMHGARFREFYAGLGAVARRYCKKIFSMAECVVALSGDWAPFFANKLPVRRLEIIGNSVSMPEGLLADGDKPLPVTILFLGRLGQRKGVYDLLEAARLLRQNGFSRPYRLILAGDGELDKCGSLVSEYGLEGTVLIPGWIDGERRRALLRESHIIALPSYAEGCPMSLLEGMSHGLPALATGIPSISAVVRGGKDGFLSAAGDAAALSGHMAELLQNDALRGDLGKNARERIRKDFSHEVVSDRIGGLYASILPL